MLVSRIDRVTSTTGPQDLQPRIHGARHPKRCRLGCRTRHGPVPRSSTAQRGSERSEPLGAPPPSPSLAPPPQPHGGSRWHSAAVHALPLCSCCQSSTSATSLTHSVTTMKHDDDGMWTTPTHAPADQHDRDLAASPSTPTKATYQGCKFKKISMSRNVRSGCPETSHLVAGTGSVAGCACSSQILAPLSRQMN